jgi:hypothetical protein
MSYRIVLGNQPLGTSELEYHDSAMGIAVGTFHPLAPYQAVRPVIAHEITRCARSPDR